MTHGHDGVHGKGNHLYHRHSSSKGKTAVGLGLVRKSMAEIVEAALVGYTSPFSSLSKEDSAPPTLDLKDYDTAVNDLLTTGDAVNSPVDGGIDPMSNASNDAGADTADDDEVGSFNDSVSGSVSAFNEYFSLWNKILHFL